MDEIEHVAAQIREGATPAMDALRSIEDPQVRVEAVTAAMEAATQLRSRLFRVKVDTLAELYAELGSWRAVGERVGLAGARCQQLVQGKNRTERPKVDEREWHEQKRTRRTSPHGVDASHP